MPSSPTPFHTFLRPEIEAPDVERAEHSGGSVAFVWDVEKDGLAPEHLECDVLYAEPPFRRGYEVFHERAGKQGGDGFATLCRRIDTALHYSRIPACILTGPDAARLYHPDFNLGTVGHPDEFGITWDVLVYNWPRTLPVASESRHALLAQMTSMGKVGDFCAGYGNTGRDVIGHGGVCVLSDLVPRCIGYISQAWEEW